MEAHDNALLSRALIGDHLPNHEEEREFIRQRALSHPDIERVYVSPDSRYATIMIKTNLGAEAVPDDHNTFKDQHTFKDQQAALVANNKLTDSGDTKNEELTDEQWSDDEFEADYATDLNASWSANTSQPSEEKAAPQFLRAELEDYAVLMDAIRPIIEAQEVSRHLTFYPAGMGPLMEYFNAIVLKQMAIVFFCSIFLILAVLWILFRSLSAVVWSLAIVLISFLWVVGLVGWSGATMTMMINIIVFLVIAVGVADAIHILSGYLYFRNLGEDHQQSLRSVFKKSGLACFLTSLTTAIGMIALTMVPIVPVQNFGIFAAFGVFFAFVITVFVLPLMLDLWAPVSKKDNPETSKRHLIQGFLRRIETLGYRYPKSITAFFGIAALILLVGAFNIRINSNLIELLPEDAPISHSVQIVDEHMAGSAVMDIIFDAGKADAFKDPRILNRMQALEGFIKQHYGADSELELIGKSTSLVNVTKDSYKALNDDDQAFYTIPQDQRLLAQTLFLFNNANPIDRRQLVSDDYSQARMTITLRNEGSYVYVPVLEAIQIEMDQLFADIKTDYPDMDVRLTGNMSLMFKLVDYISWSQVKSFGLALSVISILLLVVFGSKRIGFIALLPNLMPIILAFGLMGHLGIPLDTDTLLIAPIIIGIAVDDTIHFLTHYRAGMYQTGNIQAAIRLSVREAGQAITFTSIVLGIGFLVFMFAPHAALRNFGILSSLAIFVALLTDLLLLPALCVLFNADFKQSRNPTDLSDQQTDQQIKSHSQA
jgi:hypothetical protein